MRQKAGLNGQLLRRIRNSLGCNWIVELVSVAGRIECWRSRSGVKDGSRAGLTGSRVVAHARIYQRTASQLKSEVLVIPTAISFVVLQELVVTDVGFGE